MSERVTSATTEGSGEAQSYSPLTPIPPSQFVLACALGGSRDENWRNIAMFSRGFWVGSGVCSAAVVKLFWLCAILPE